VLSQPYLHLNVKSNAVRQRRPHDKREMTPDLPSYLRRNPEAVRSYALRQSAKLFFKLKTDLCDSGMRGHSADLAPLGTCSRPRSRLLCIAPPWAGGRIGENPNHNKCT
jgi:hypothetical protein